MAATFPWHHHHHQSQQSKLSLDVAKYSLGGQNRPTSRTTDLGTIEGPGCCGLKVSWTEGTVTGQSLGFLEARGCVWSICASGVPLGFWAWLCHRNEGQKGESQDWKGDGEVGRFHWRRGQDVLLGGGLITQGQRGDHLGYRTERLGKTSDSGQETKIDYVSWTPWGGELELTPFHQAQGWKDCPMQRGLTKLTQESCNEAFRPLR